jgi:hypothetical protein
MSQKEAVWFRVTVQHYATVNEHGDVDGHYSNVTVTQFPVLKHTPKGVWLEIPLSAKKFVLREMLHRGRAYAAPTLEQAKQDFIARKQFERNRLESRINRIDREIALVSQGSGGIIS